ncbi:MAG: HAD family hydrolase, partial [Planctomycetota bacterium]
LVSNKPESLTREMLRQLEISHQFVEVYGGDTLKRKPDPGAVLQCLERYGVPGGECLLVGDSLVDVQTAAAAGVDMCAVTYGYHRPGDLDGVRMRIDRFSDLLQALGSGPATGGR